MEIFLDLNAQLDFLWSSLHQVIACKIFYVPSPHFRLLYTPKFHIYNSRQIIHMYQIGYILYLQEFPSLL